MSRLVDVYMMTVNTISGRSSEELQSSFEEGVLEGAGLSEMDYLCTFPVDGMCPCLFVYQ